MKGAFLFVAFLTFAVIAASGQQNAPCVEHEILVTVTTDAYQPVSDITADKFRGEIHGKSVVVTGVLPFSGSRRTVLLLDGSGSMRDKWPFALSVLGRIVVRAPDNSWLALARIGSKAEQIPFSKTGRIEIDERLRHYLQQPNLPHGESPLIDGIEKALTMLDPVQPGDAIYLVSDGGENSSNERLGELQNNLLSKRVRLFSVLLGNVEVLNSGIPNEKEREDLVLFRSLSERSGGLAIVVKNPKATAELNKAVAAILQDQPFRLRFRVPQVVEKPTPWKLQFVDSHGKPAKRLTLQYPHTLQPCELH